MGEIKPGIWRHYKGGLYEVLFCATHTETGEPMVVYRAMYGEHKIWVRPASMWHESIPDTEGVPRFVFLTYSTSCYNCFYGGDGEEIDDNGYCWKHNGEPDYIQPPKEQGCGEWRYRYE